MQSSSRAPVLSATLSRDSCWIMGLTGPLQHFHQSPALGAAERTALDYAHRVSNVRLVALVVCVERRGSANDLLVHPVLTGDVDLDRDRLVGLVGHHDALTHLERALGGTVLDRRSRCLATWLAGPALTLLLAVGAALPSLGPAQRGACLSALLGRPLRTSFAAVGRTR